MTQLALLALVWLSVVVFVAGCAWRAWRYASAPMHLRWDLYPVAHEPPSRREYGGSRLEEREYWNKPAHRSLVGEVTTMLEEIVLLRGVWLHNRRVFRASFPFHWGLYLLLGASGLVALMAVGLEWTWLHVLVGPVATAGGLLTALGALLLLRLRLTDPALKRYSAPADRLNLLVFAALGILSAAVALSSSGMDAVVVVVARGLRFQPPDAPPLLTLQIIFACLVLIYLPFTRMVHFFAKYFLYHEVRWDDHLLRRGTAMERSLQAALNFGVTWSADHVGGRRSWAQIATDKPSDGRKS